MRTLLGHLGNAGADLRCQLVRVSDYAFDVAVGLDQLRGRLVADARHAREVVRRLALEGDEIGPLLRRNAVLLHHSLGVEPGHIGDAAPRHHHADAIAHELEHVAVARDDQYLVAFRLRLLGQRGQQVVGFVAFELDDRDAHRVEDFADQRELLAELIGGLAAVGLVLRVAIVAVSGPASVEADGNAVGLLVAP